MSVAIEKDQEYYRDINNFKQKTEVPILFVPYKVFSWMRWQVTAPHRLCLPNEAVEFLEIEVFKKRYFVFCEL